MTRVVIVPVPKTGPRGDRDTQRHPYNDYEIHIVADGATPSKDTVVHEVSGFNSWHCTIEPETQTKNEAQKYAERLANRIGASLEWDGEGCEAWTVSIELIVLAKDQAHALELFEQRFEAGDIKPHAYKQRGARR